MEINLFDIIKAIRNRFKLFLLLVTCSSVLVFMPFYFLANDEFKSHAILEVKTSDIGSSSKINSALTQVFGGSAESSNAFISKINLIYDSESFYKELFSRGFEKVTNENYSYNLKENVVVSEDEAISLQKRIQIFKTNTFRYEVDVINNGLRISTKTLDPYLSQLILEEVIELTDEIIKESERSRSQGSLKNIENMINSSQWSSREIVENLNQLILSNLQTLSMLDIEEYFAFSLIDAPTFPESPESKNNLEKLILIFIFSLILNGILVFILSRKNK